MPKIWRVYSGADGQSHVEEVPLAMTPFTDTEGAHGEGTPMQPAAGIVFRAIPGEIGPYRNNNAAPHANIDRRIISPSA